LQIEKEVRGKLEIEVRIKGEGAQIVELRIDGNLRGIKNFPPFLFSIDTKELEDGEHTIEVLAKDSNGETIASQKENIYVDNEGNFKD
ncbi:MAG: Ig-like domain-containing protein, partial [bacterium]